MSVSDSTSPEALNEAMRKPLSPGFGLARILFAIVTYMMFAESVDPTLFKLWGILWAVRFAKDAFTGLTPFQTMGEAVFGAVCWISWVALFFG